MSLTAKVATLISEKQIPALDKTQMLGLLHHLFTSTPTVLRIQVAEVAYRYDHDQPHAMDVFLASTFPLAERVAFRRATKILVQPSDWAIEKMYDGAVEAIIEVWQTHRALKPIENAFRRYLLLSMGRGALRAYFTRADTHQLRTITNFESFTRAYKTKVEDEIITWELLECVVTFPGLRPAVRAVLECIRSLGPDHAIKEHAFTASGNPDAWKRELGRRPILNPKVIAEAMGISKAQVHQHLREARVILREAFNRDGNLFNR